MQFGKPTFHFRYKFQKFIRKGFFSLLNLCYQFLLFLAVIIDCPHLTQGVHKFAIVFGFWDCYHQSKCFFLNYHIFSIFTFKNYRLYIFTTLWILANSLFVRKFTTAVVPFISEVKAVSRNRDAWKYRAVCRHGKFTLIFILKIIVRSS